MRTFHTYHDIYLYIEPLTDDEPDSRTRHQISNCFCFLEDYLNLTTNQYMRVKDNREKISSLSEHTWELHDTLNIMFGDLHFLLIAIDKAYSLSIKLLNLLGETASASSLSHSKYRMNLKHFRNNLEHMDEKLTTELWDAYDNITSIIQDKYISKNKKIVDRIWNGHKGPIWEK